MTQIKVKEISPTSLRVGNKVVYQDSNNNWVAVSELTTAETEALQAYLLNQDELC